VGCAEKAFFRLMGRAGGSWVLKGFVSGTIGVFSSGWPQAWVRFVIFCLQRFRDFDRSVFNVFKFLEPAGK